MRDSTGKRPARKLNAVKLLILNRATPEPDPRLEPILPHLRDDGLSVSRTRVRSNPFRRVFQFLHAPSYDVVWLRGRPLGRFWIRRLRASSRALIYELDSPHFLQRVPGSARPRWGELRRFGHTVNAAQYTIVPNDYLAGHARKYTHPDRVRILPPSLDLSCWSAKQEPRRQHRLVLGWHESFSDPSDLLALQPALARVAELHPQVELRTFASRPVTVPGIRTYHQLPNPRCESEDLSAFDIALYPSPDDAWTMAHFPLSLLKVMAIGLPIVAGDSESVRRVVSDHRNALLAGGLEEWDRKISLLADAPGLADALGAEARRTVERIYASERVSRGYLSILRAAVLDAGAARRDDR